MANNYEFYRNLPGNELAKIIGKTAPVIASWCSQGMPFNGEGRKKSYDIAKIIEWLQKTQVGLPKSEIKKSQKSIESDDMLQDGPAFDDNLDRYRSAKADLAEMEFKKRKGELIELEAHQKFVQEAGSFCRQSFQNIPKKISVQLAKIHDSQQVEKVLESEIAKVLKDLSEKKV
jgi:phage terminase Nu1 subunit (DNA packaging protein)